MRAMDKPKLPRHITADAPPHPPPDPGGTTKIPQGFCCRTKSVIILKRVAAAASSQAATVPLAHNGPHICCLLDAQHVLHAPHLRCKILGAEGNARRQFCNAPSHRVIDVQRRFINSDRRQMRHRGEVRIAGQLFPTLSLQWHLLYTH